MHQYKNIQFDYCERDDSPFIAIVGPADDLETLANAIADEKRWDRVKEPLFGGNFVWDAARAYQNKEINFAELHERWGSGSPQHTFGIVHRLTLDTSIGNYGEVGALQLFYFANIGSDPFVDNSARVRKAFDEVKETFHTAKEKL
jgi:hypothetical protein